MGQHSQSGPRREEKESEGAEGRRLHTTDLCLRLDRSQDEGEPHPKGDGSREGKGEQVEMHVRDDARRRRLTPAFHPLRKLLWGRRCAMSAG